MDQVLVLRWVRENIITVFGQSAGSTDLGLLMTSRGRKLFQKAIEESGAPFGVPTLAQAEQSGVGLAAALKAPPGDAVIAHLRKIPASVLIAKIAALPAAQQFHPVPDIDGRVLERAPARVVADGLESPISLLFGTTTRELSQPTPTAVLRAMIEQEAGNHAAPTLAVFHCGRSPCRRPRRDLLDELRADRQPEFGPPSRVAILWEIAQLHPVPPGRSRVDGS